MTVERLLLAPAPIDSIAMTAPTPKIMPSMVSDVRSLCGEVLERDDEGIEDARIALPPPPGPPRRCPPIA